MSTFACIPPSGDAQMDIVASPILSIAVLAVWRSATALYLWGLIIYNTTRLRGAGKVFTQFNTLTNQSLLLSAIYYTLAAASPVYSYVYPHKERERYKLMRILINLQSLCVPLAMTVILGFWSFIPNVTVHNIHNHGMLSSVCR